MLDNIILFTILAENKNFTKTAEQVFLSQSTLSKRIAELEVYFGANLIIHNTRKFELTTDGEIIYQRFKHLRKYLSDSVNFLHNHNAEASGELRVSIAAVFAYELICPYIDEFIQKYPSIKLSIIFQQDMPKLDENNIDIAITCHQFQHPDYDCTFLRREIGQLFCTPSYVKKFGVPQYIEDLHNHRFIGIIDTISKENNRIIKVINRHSQAEYIFDNSQHNLKTNLASHMKQIGMYGDYIFGCWYCLCEDDIRNGRLIHVLPDYETVDAVDFFLITPHKPSLIETYFIDFIYRCINRSTAIDSLYKYNDTL